MPRKELVGKVVSNKMDKTVVVAIESYFPHPKYEKQIVKTKKFKAHDAENKCRIGDIVRLRECRPLSRDKHFLVVAVTGRAEERGVVSEGAEA